VHPVQGGYVAAAQLLCHLAVGEQHQLFDEAPGSVALDWRNVQGSLVIDVDLGLCEVEVERTGPDTTVAQLLAEVEEHFDVTLELALARWQATALCELLHLLVGEPGV